MRSSHTDGAENTERERQRETEKFTDTYDVRICVRFIPMVQRTHKQREKFFS